MMPTALAGALIPTSSHGHFRPNRFRSPFQTHNALACPLSALKDTPTRSVRTALPGCEVQAVWGQIGRGRKFLSLRLRPWPAPL